MTTKYDIKVRFCGKIDFKKIFIPRALFTIVNPLQSNSSLKENQGEHFSFEFTKDMSKNIGSHILVTKYKL